METYYSSTETLFQETPRNTVDKRIYPLSYNQKAFWFLHQSTADKASYNVAFTCKIVSEIDLTHLQSAFQTLLDKYEVLRTNFCFQEGELVQLVTNQDIFFKQINVEEYSEEETKNLVVKRYKKPFDLEKDQLLRVWVFSKNEKEHILLINTHHIVFDAWSQVLFVEELNQILKNTYQATTNSTFYQDYVDWQTENLASEKGNQLKKYWQRVLADELPKLKMPTDFSKNTNNITDGNTHIFYLPTIALKNFAKQHKTTPFAVLLTTYVLSLYKYSGQSSIMIGVPVTGRSTSKFRNSLGCFINQVPLKISLENSQTIVELLSNTTKLLIDGIRNQDYPLALISESLNNLEDRTGNSIFQTLINYVPRIPNLEHISDMLLPSENPTTFQLGNYQAESYYIPQQEGRFEISMEFMESTDSVLASVKYDPSLFKKSTILRFSNHFRNLLTNIIECSTEQTISEIDYLDEAEKDLVLNQFNNTESEYPTKETLKSLFETQVNDTPDAVALVFEDIQLTYRQINEKANQLANFLQNNFDVKTNDTVGVLLERSEKMMISLLAIIKAGAAYVPIDPDFPSDRKEYIIKDSQIKALITENYQLKGISDCPPMVVLDEQAHQIVEFSRNNPTIFPSPNHLAYIIYTSGSTGNPKGCELNHTGVVNRINWMRNHYNFDKNDVILQKTNYVFDVSVWEIFLTFCYGCKMVLCQKKDILYPQTLVEIIQKNGVTSLHFVPSALNVFLDGITESNKKQLQSLRQIFVSGEALPTNSVYQHYEKLGQNIKLHNLYGPTEASVDVTYFETSPTDKVIPIGKPIDNIKMYVLDNSLKPVGVGIVGEICISGIGLARGYRNRTELTSQKFVQNPYGTNTYSRLYLTGDLGRWLSNGEIEYLGRKDNQIKLRGYRIELGEIEQVILSFEHITLTVVMLRGEGEKKYLVAYLVGIEQAKIQDLKDYLRSKLPEYMIPTYFVCLEDMPRTASGKLDRNRLPDVKKVMESLSVVAPTNEVESKIYEIWQRILGRNGFGITDKFFEVGGDSLKCIRLISNLQQSFGLKFQIQDLFQKTIQELAQDVKNTKPEINPTIKFAQQQKYYELSLAQKSLWALDRLVSDLTAYNYTVRYDIEGKLNIKIFFDTLNKIIERHEILRTSFKELEGEPKQVIFDKNEHLFVPQYHDFTQKAVPDKEVKKYLETESRTLFNLSTDSLIRLSVLKTDTDKYSLVCSTHHIISDGWSMMVFMKEVSETYNALLDNDEDPLTTTHFQYKDYVFWQKEELNKSQDKLNYWKNKFAIEPLALQLPTDRPRQNSKSFNGKNLTFSINKRTKDQLQVYASRHKVSLFTVLMAGVRGLLYRYTNQSESVIGIALSGRTIPEFQDQIGLYVNINPVLSSINANSTFSELVSIENKNIEEVFENQIAFEKLIEELNINPDRSRSPLFDVAVNFQDESMLSGKLHMKGFHIKDYQVCFNQSKYDLLLDFSNSETQIVTNIIYNTDLFDEYRIQNLFQHLQILLNQAILEENRRISELNIISKEEYQILLNDFAGKINTVEQKTLGELFEIQAEIFPEKTAVIFKETTLSYKQLNEKANILANYLLEKYALVPNDIVALALERSEKMMIAIMGVLKAGLAYLPLDVSNPSERLNLILTDSQASVLITQEAHKNIFSDTVSIETIDELLQGKNTSNPVTITKPEDLAYVIYTSGSTGQPKGCELSHIGIVNLNHHVWNQYDFSINDVVLQRNAHVFDPSVHEISFALTYGMSLVVCDETEIYTPEKIIELIHQFKVSYIHFVPSLYRTFIGELTADNLNKLSSLRYVFLGGESLPLPLVKEHYEKLSIPLCNVYGPTETSVWVTENVLNPATQSVSIGKPIQNSGILILNENGAIQPVGVDGEICVYGKPLAKKYRNREELTNEKFALNPFNSKQKIYKTGDLGRWLPNGEIEYISRVDNQVKIRGYRVELGEIEKVIETFPAIKQSVVDIRQDGNSNFLIAYIVGVKAEKQSEIKNFLAEKLPNYMIPQFFHFIDTLPITISGKVDKQKLASINFSQTNDTNDFQAPTNLIEEKLCSIWENVLNRKKVGIHDNFFEIGGDSIKAIQIVSASYKQGLKLDIKQIFDNKTIENLAKTVKNTEEILQIDQIEQSGEVLLSPIQQEFFARTQTDRHHFNQALLFQADQSINIGAITQVINKLWQHHDTLRLVYDAQNEYKQTYLPVNGSEIVVEEVFVKEEEDANLSIEKIINEANSSFDLSKGPLIKALVLRIKGGDRFFLVIHHLVVDAVSWRILMEDIGDLYPKAFAGKQLDLPGKTTSFKRWVAELQNYANSITLQKEKTYWQAVEYSISQNIPRDIDFKDKSYYHNFHSITCQIDEHNTEKLLFDISKIFNANINDILVTAIANAVNQIWGLSSISLNLEGHGRENINPDLDLSRTIGWFTTTYPLVVSINNQNSLTRNLKEIKETLNKIPNKGIGYGILKYLSSDTDFRKTNAVNPQISFNYLGQLDADVSETGWRLAEQSAGNTKSLNGELWSEIGIDAIIKNKKLSLEISFDSQRFKSQTIEIFKENIEKSIIAIASLANQNQTKEFSPSDFTYKGLSIDEIEGIFD